MVKTCINITFLISGEFYLYIMIVKWQYVNWDKNQQNYDERNIDKNKTDYFIALFLKAI